VERCPQVNTLFGIVSASQKQWKDSMTFASQASAAAILVIATLWLQGAGMAALIPWARACIARGIEGLGAWRSAALMIRFTIAMIVLHVLEILLWAGFYRWRCLSSWESAFYFSATSYSTVGYGDVVLPQLWRILGPVESVLGILMCGMSVSALFAITLRLVGTEAHSSTEANTHPALHRRSDARLVNFSDDARARER
jgi:voltage-gated potassium channel